MPLVNAGAYGPCMSRTTSPISVLRRKINTQIRINISKSEYVPKNLIMNALKLILLLFLTSSP